jgi:hypothetical protein
MHDLIGKDAVLTPTGEKNLIDSPPHYTQGKIECIDYILDKQMNYLEGNIIKYVTRYKDKGGVQDLFKARWYLNKLIDEQFGPGIEAEEEPLYGESPVATALAALRPLAAAIVDEQVSDWKRKSPGATGEATINDEYYQLSKEDEDEYIKSLNQLHIEPGVPFEPNDGVLPEDDNDWSEEDCWKRKYPRATEDDNDWSEENCRRPFDIEGKQIVDDRVIELVVEEPTPAYPKGHPYTTEYPTPSPCGHHSRGCIHRG